MGPAEAFAYDQIPPVLRAKVAPTLKTAYAAARTIIKNEPILNVASAEDNAGRIIQWAVDFGFEKLVKTGEWPFDMRWRPFHKPTGRYLEILASHSAITLSQTSDPTKQPREVKFRQNKRVNNQRDLFETFKPRSSSGLIHMLLLHGHQDLNFAHLGVPHEQRKFGYHYKSTNLLDMPHEVASPVPAMEDTDYEIVMTLKEDIDRWRRDNGVE